MPGPPHTPASDANRLPAARYLRAAGEAVSVALVVFAPWPLASHEPRFECWLAVGVLVLVILSAAHAVAVRRFTFRPDILSVSLAGMVLLSAIQLIPLPETLVGVFAPSRLDWHRDLLPERFETLPGESGSTARPGWLALSVDPSATRTFLARVLALLMVYLAVRNWLASRASFRRLAWAATANGLALAIFAIGHSVSAPRGVVYWTIPVEGDGGFGPFICRNHFTDYVALCAGLGIGLLLPRAARRPDDGPRPDQGLLTPRSIALIGAVGMMLVSVPFSLSRGGTLAVVAAGAAGWLLTRLGSRAADAGKGRFALAAVIAVGVLIAAWVGADAVEARLATLGTGEGLDSRLPLWRDAVRLLPGFWAAGTGNGTFVWVEPTVRTTTSASVYYENAHNEYLEAFVEGGVVRFALTLALAGGALWVIGRGFLQRRDRSIGPLLIGAWFGLAVVVFHAIGDFGIHIPAIAVMTVVVAAYAMAAAADTEFVPPRVRVRKVRNGDAVASEVATTDAPPSQLRDDGVWTVEGWQVVAIGIAAAMAALLVAADAFTRDRSERLKVSGELVYWEFENPDRLSKRADYYDARAAVRPDDPDALFEAAQAHLDAAIADAWGPGAGLAGGAAGFLLAPNRFSQTAIDRHVIPALRHLQAARSANPLAPKPHTRLGLYADYFASTDPAAVHFARAKRLLPTDPDVWFAAGREAFRRGDRPAAWQDWRRSLVLSPRHAKPILAAAREKLTPAELRERVLPDDPVALMAAAVELYPDRESTERRGFAEAAAAWAGRPGLTGDQLAGIAAAFDDLGRPDDALDSWIAAVQAAPQRVDLRDRLARWLEGEERYEEAIPHLEWLRVKEPGNQAVNDRLDAARHALRLQKAITGD